MADARQKTGRLRPLPYGANYLDWHDMHELRAAIESRVLFRYQTPEMSQASKLEDLAKGLFGVRHALALQNCTQGLRVALVATQPSVGDVVYVPAVTFVAVVGAVLSCGLIPVLLDVDDHFRFDFSRLPADAERAIVAHMEGAVNPIRAGCKYVIEDAAQALGAHHQDGRMVGACGYAGVFSFHHNKVLTSGEGGLLITNSDRCYELSRAYHDHGATRVHGAYPTWKAETFFGENLVASEATAAIQLQQFRWLDDILAGLERGYAVMRELVPERGFFSVIDRGPGDVKVSLRVLFESTEHRQRAMDGLRQRQLPHWTLDKYFLPDHPVFRDRQSIYSDGFPWNLVGSIDTAPCDYSDT
ncbi:MAG: aminotransferase, partial [Thiotrichales bacterium SG8_50]